MSNEGCILQMTGQMTVMLTQRFNSCPIKSLDAEMDLGFESGPYQTKHTKEFYYGRNEISSKSP